ncbi:hypothetical protein OUY22_02870 [Nonomuraea sp. MCN248]|uniref:Uncharacterized protein n=1 Tax=Nonomuraea corallina TaxID=2989783 RepID=A0ABT4S5L0_9ACTN|nr:hypothetical protein [Nonomuraea corallina]MDA0632343.1 hypothetical protein [Nonomuraea corallina]
MLGQATHSASLALRDRIEIDPDAATMGTTLVAMLQSETGGCCTTRCWAPRQASGHSGTAVP